MLSLNFYPLKAIVPITMPVRTGGVFISTCLALALSLVHSASVSADITQAGFQAALDNARSSTNTRSISATIIRDEGVWGESVWNAVANKAGRSNPVDVDTHLSIASMTKTYIAALIIELIEENELTLDTSMNTLLYSGINPVLTQDYMNEISPDIKLRNLLNHTSGIDEYLGNSYYYAIAAQTGKVWSPYDTLDYVNQPYFVFDPSDPSPDYNYTNTNYVLLGMIIEHITGTDVLSALQAKLLGPLGLNNTYMRGLESIPAPSAVGYEVGLFGYYKTSTLVGSGTALYTSTFTCGNMVATAEDAARWAKVYYDLQDSTFDLDSMPLSASRTVDGFTEEYGLGIKRASRDDAPYASVLWGHTGTISGFNGLLYYWPEKGISIAILTNEHYAQRYKLLAEIVKYINENDQ